MLREEMIERMNPYDVEDDIGSRCMGRGVGLDELELHEVSKGGCGYVETV
jgi:hypothetical protein